MTYTPFILCACALLGVISHHLVKLDSLNRQNNGKINFGQYFMIERFTLALSLIVSFGSAFLLNHEIAYYLENLGFIKYFGGMFVFLGYSAQSLLVKFIGRTNKVIVEQQKNKD